MDQGKQSGESWETWQLAVLGGWALLQIGACVAAVTICCGRGKTHTTINQYFQKDQKGASGGGTASGSTTGVTEWTLNKVRRDDVRTSEEQQKVLDAAYKKKNSPNKGVDRVVSESESLSKVVDSEMMKFTVYQLRDLAQGMTLTQAGNKTELIEKIVEKARQCGVTIPQIKYLVSLYNERHGRTGILPVDAFESKAGATAFITSILEEMRGPTNSDGSRSGLRWVPKKATYMSSDGGCTG